MAPQSWPKQLIVYAAIEVVSALVGTTGVVVEFIYGADVGVMMITGGSVLFGVGASLWAKAYIGWRQHG